MTPESRASELANAHWTGYVKPLLEAHGEETENIAVIGFHYVSSAVHFYKHAVADLRAGMFPAVSEERYQEIHTPLPADLVAELAKWPCVAPAKNPILKTCATCADTGCCNTGRTSNGCSLHTPLPAEEVERISREVASASLCDSCAKADVSCPVYPAPLSTVSCVEYVSSLREQIAEAKEPQPLDLSLPSIALECTAEEAWEKLGTERQEWVDAKIGSFEELVEKWDCLQAHHTYKERGGIKNTTDVTGIETYYHENRPVMRAKAAMLLKNAQRGYYSPETCAIIIASNGERWK